MQAHLLFEAITYGLLHLGPFEAHEEIVGTDSPPLSTSVSV